MKTYQDLLKAIAEGKTGDFLYDAVDDHRGTQVYKDALDGMAYYRKHNITIEKFQKFLYTISGRRVPDLFSSNYKLKSLFFRRLVTQQASYVLANGVEIEGKERLGAAFDKKLFDAALMSLAQGVAYGYWNYDHLEIFTLADTPGCPGFVPLLDEDTSELKAGIRYWYRGVGNDTLFRATLYEPDGVSEWGGKNGKDIAPLSEKRGYKRHTSRNEVVGVIDQCDENYTRLPIAILWGNDTHESELVGLRESIDCYDLVRSGLANNIDDSSDFYWLVKNSGSMDDVDLAQFVQRIKTAHAASVDSNEGGGVEAHTLNVPVEARKTMLEILRRDIYEDAQMLDVEKLAGADKTATEIQAAYQAQDNKCSAFEYQLIDFIAQICDIAGIPNPEPKFKWNKVINMKEQTEMVMLAASYLDDKTILKHLPWLLPEGIEGIMQQKAAEDLNRMGGNKSPEDVIDNG